MSRNIHIIVGRVGKTPELKKTASGALTNLSVATTESWKNKKGEKEEETQWHNVVAWNATAEWVAENVNVGDSVYCEGPSKTSTYTNNDGAEKQITELKARSIQKLGGKPEVNGNVDF